MELNGYLDRAAAIEYLRQHFPGVEIDLPEDYDDHDHSEDFDLLPLLGDVSELSADAPVEELTEADKEQFRIAMVQALKNVKERMQSFKKGYPDFSEGEYIMTDKWVFMDKGGAGD